MSLLVGLAEDTQRSILGAWVYLCDVVRVDAAHCSHVDRTAWLTVLPTLGLEQTFPAYPTVTPGRYSWYSEEHSERALSIARKRHACLLGKMMNWVMLRSIPAKEFWIVQRKVSGPDRRSYLRNHRWSVQKIRFERVEDPWRMFCKEKSDPMVKVALNDVCSYCPKVTALHFSRRMSSEEPARIMHTWPAQRRDTPLLRAMVEHLEWVAIRIADGASVTCDWNAYCRNVSTHLRHVPLDVQIDAHTLLALIRSEIVWGEYVAAFQLQLQLLCDHLR